MTGDEGGDKAAGGKRKAPSEESICLDDDDDEEGAADMGGKAAAGKCRMLSKHLACILLGSFRQGAAVVCVSHRPFKLLRKAAYASAPVNTFLAL